MPMFNYQAVTAVIVSVVASASLMACNAGTIAANIQKDGSIEFVTTGQVSKGTAEAKLLVKRNQGISIDPTGIEGGSFHIDVIKEAEEGEGEGKPEAGSSSQGNDTSEQTKGDGADAGDDKTVTTSTIGDTSGSTGSDDASPASDTRTITKTQRPLGSTDAEKPMEVAPNVGDVVFSRTFSSMDGRLAEDSIATVTAVDDGLYRLEVTVEGALGTMMVRAYDLSDEELTERDMKRIYDSVSDWFRSLTENSGAEGAPKASSETTETPTEAKATSDAISS